MPGDTICDDLQSFATALLERRGALVDWPAGAGEGAAIVPPEVAAALGTQGDVVPLSTEPGRAGWCVNLAGDFLETAGRVLHLEPQIGDFEIADAYLKRGTLNAAVERAFGWLNVKVTIADTRTPTVEYHTWRLRAAISSEDRWESRIDVTINSASGAEIDLPDPFGQWGLRGRGSSSGQPSDATYERAVSRAVPRLQEAASEFFRRMDARLAADRRRLQEYYGALIREAGQKKSRGHEPTDEAKIAEKIAANKRAVNLELRRKLAELEERYAMQVVIEPLILVRTAMPVLAVDLLVQRKRARRTHVVYWNPLLRQLEPMCCSRCGNGAFAMAFTDETVDPLCSACAK